MTERRQGGHSPHVALLAAASMYAPEPASESADAPAARERVPDFAAVYEQHFDFVWRSVRRLGVAERWLDDAVQDVFLVVHRRLHEFEGRSTLKSWIFGIARRVAHDHRRRAERKDRGDALPDAVADLHTPTPLESAVNAEAARLLHELLGALDDDKREVFLLAELEQMSVPEIAEAISVNLNTVYSRLRAARRAFDQAVSRHLARERSGQ